MAQQYTGGKKGGKGKFADPKAKHNKKDFELGGLLGGGAFAKVVEGKVTNEDSPFHGRKFAVKILDKRHIEKRKGDGKEKGKRKTREVLSMEMSIDGEDDENENEELRGNFHELLGMAVDGDGDVEMTEKQ